jgi:hypothetical protein
MATTESGYRYPVGTDKVRDGDNAIEALARDVQSLNYPRNAGATLSGAPPTPRRPLKTYSVRGATTSNGSGQCSITFSAALGFVALYSWHITPVSSGLIFWLDGSQLPVTTALIFIVGNPATGAPLPNRALEYVATFIGE